MDSVIYNHIIIESTITEWIRRFSLPWLPVP